ncbi:hypothetical protein [Halalkalibacter krulwichiae]|uniref:Uncharacterized protein n=1 Tax=Halalkalibacter krulwichiae TaxID=199441 RepID=A0A1X9MEP4_9BACI|nr:hypothetical protein [Halalkalibacter krulwichiae]ARK31919.1 hypothetical protein BkAM31D_19880 [Halalkalibacter krulwichiae]
MSNMVFYKGPGNPSNNNINKVIAEINQLKKINNQPDHSALLSQIEFLISQNSEEAIQQSVQPHLEELDNMIIQLKSELTSYERNTKKLIRKASTKAAKKAARKAAKRAAKKARKTTAHQIKKSLKATTTSEVFTIDEIDEFTNDQSSPADEK